MGIRPVRYLRCRIEQMSDYLIFILIAAPFFAFAAGVWVGIGLD
jgi:hypothetical protein